MRTRARASVGFLGGMLIGIGAIATACYGLLGAPWVVYLIGVLLIFAGIVLTAIAEIRRSKRERES
jgi:uncharacterized membrane protein HdeD (DUF308 family)